MTSVHGIIVGAPSSGSGKTVFTLALLRALARNGTTVASAKVGPDYIDPAFHALASGRPCLNLDLWAMRAETVRATAARLAADADFVVCEGVMGLFDGAASDEGSTADLAALSGWPVVLVVDAGAQAASAAAVVRGFATHRDDVDLAGVVFNRIGSAAHGDILRRAIADSLPEIPVLGCIARNDLLVLPERHLGLVQAGEHGDLDGFLDIAADLITDQVDVAALVDLATSWQLDAAEPALPPRSPLPPLGQRIAVADDIAFTFRYAMVIDGWRAAGAEIVPFSPIADETPGGDADAVYLPGGYPELHAGRLAGNGIFLAGLRAAAGRGARLFGECGGYMVLGRGLVDAGGTRHAMAGLLPVETSFENGKLHLGYRRACLAGDGPLGATGMAYRGHEFHYAEVLSEGQGSPLFQCANARGDDLGASGMMDGEVMGSFVHLVDRDD
jgi:cobyrinic acid a,c-diamide synthase